MKVHDTIKGGSPVHRRPCRWGTSRGARTSSMRQPQYSETIINRSQMCSNHVCGGRPKTHRSTLGPLYSAGCLSATPPTARHETGRFALKSTLNFVQPRAWLNKRIKRVRMDWPVTCTSQAKYAGWWPRNSEMVEANLNYICVRALMSSGKRVTKVYTHLCGATTDLKLVCSHVRSVDGMCHAPRYHWHLVSPSRSCEYAYGQPSHHGQTLYK